MLNLSPIYDTGAKALVGGASAEWSGGDFNNGFNLVALTTGAGHMYNNLLGYDPEWKASSKGAGENGKYDYTESAYGSKIKVPGMDTDTFGMNDELTGTWYKDILKQGGAVRFLAKLPGMQAVSKPHDLIQTALSHATPGSEALRTTLNVPAMVPAAAITYGGLLAPHAPTLINSDL